MTGEVYYSTGPHLAESARNTLTLVKELPPPRPPVKYWTLSPEPVEPVQ